MGNFLKQIVSFFLPESYVERLFNPNGQKYFFHVGWNLFGRLIYLPLAFLVNVYLVRYLGPQQWGTLSYVVSFVGIFSFLASLGVDSILYVDLVKEPQNKDKLLGTAFGLKCLGSVLSFGVIMGASLFMGNSSFVMLIMAIVAASIFFQPINIVNYFFQAKVQSKPTVISSLIISFLMAGLKIFFVYFEYSLVYFALIYLFEAVLMAFGYWYIYQHSGEKISKWSFDKVLAFEMFKYSWPLILSSAFAMIYSRIDQVMIKHYMSETAVGFYDTAVRIAEMWYILPTIIVGSVMPAVLNAKTISNEFYSLRLKRLYSFVIYFSLIFILPISLGSNYIISFLYGPEFFASAVVLRFYVWAGVAVLVGTVLNQYLLGEKETKVSLAINLAGMILNIILNVILIPKKGLAGAALSTMISYSIIPLTVIFFPKIRWQLSLMLKAILIK